MEVKYIKLVNGEEIIAEIENNNAIFFTVHNPIALQVVKFTQGDSVIETFVMQPWLKISKTQADKMINLKEFLKERMRETYIKESNNGETSICTKEEMVEFLEDGNVLLDWFQKSKNFNRFFSLKHDELVAIEQPINTKIGDNVNFMGFIDLVIRDTFNGRYRIVDFKTSTRGWSKYQKSDPVKNAQILLYKKYYSDMFNIQLSKIKVMFSYELM
mgnify:CR=1 FL=1